MNDRQQADARLAEDIRLLGRLLGETLRRHEGEATFDMIEEIRQLAVASRRLDDTASQARLAKVLDGLSTAQAVLVVRAFSYFSLLANIAEDRAHVRRHRENRRAGNAPLPSTLAGIVAEAMVALVLAEAFLEKFGGDSVEETRRNYENYVANLTIR